MRKIRKGLDFSYYKTFGPKSCDPTKRPSPWTQPMDLALESNLGTKPRNQSLALPLWGHFQVAIWVLTFGVSLNFQKIRERMV